ncbi:MAG: DedA family protein, partial [Hyphomicrobiales bacterium]|nr:DedA family protein [Hyphomicrobiales bacterium]MCY4049417.1 DedA family protein [Hyphomicrobiales bacterium]
PSRLPVPPRGQRHHHNPSNALGQNDNIPYTNTMLEKLRTWTLSLAERPGARRTLALVSFAESSFFPIPPDLLLFPMTLQTPHHAWRLAIICTAASVLGGVAGYALGYAFFDSIGIHIINFYGLNEQFDKFEILYNEWGIVIILIAGFTPIPYKVFTIASGIAALNLPLFVAASLAARGARYFLVCWLTKRFGAPIKSFLEKQLGWVGLVGILMAVAFFLLLRPIVNFAAP